MTPKLHRQFLDIAGEFSPELRGHMRDLGPVQIPNRKHLGIAQFLARVIIEIHKGNFKRQRKKLFLIRA